MRRRQVVLGAVGVAAAALVIAGAIAGAASAPTAAPSTAPATTAPASETPHPLYAGGYQDPATGSASSEQRAAVEPVRVRIPAIGVDSGLEQLGIDGTGALTPPVDFDLAGWFAGGVTPGQVGPAIIAGHVDSVTAPAVFYRVGELKPGDEVDVDMSDGTTVVFTVTGSMQSAKSEFPTSDVYSTVPRPELRLITCAGAFDRSIGHYTDNLIVFAALAA